ncbi:hypothetical protein HY256_11060 [Candidatus Sumerlaeota bacterium]|nr:hypothetical protein [Candidatus Sumerlaeota bacterium]
MPIQTDIGPIVEYVRKRLAEACDRGIHLVINDEGTKLEDEWLYVTLAPGKSGGRASDYADLMDEIETELRNQGHSHVLLVPVVPD